ncbi:MAG: hypothetical protein RR370_01690 [Synergistaceae bacterium]
MAIVYLNDITAKLYITNYENFLKYFDESVVLHQAKMFDELLFSTSVCVTKDGSCDRVYQRLGYPCLSKDINTEIETHYREYRVPKLSKLSEGNLIRNCINAQYPYMDGLSIECYHLDGVDEVYVKCDNWRSLPLPLIALKNEDFSIIENRMVSHLSIFHDSSDREKLRIQALNVLQTDTAQYIKNHISDCAKDADASMLMSLY